MATSRRDFLHHFAIGATALAATPSTLLAGPPALREFMPGGGSSEWDTTWLKRISGKHRAVFDCTEVESGYGVWRSAFWGGQVQEVLGARPRDITAVLVLRHNAITLAMQQSYWEEYEVGKAHGVTHPITQQGTARNPALLTNAVDPDFPTQFDSFALPKVIESGVITLGCALAFDFDVVPTIMKKDGVSESAAREKGRSMMVPGVVMQPSGVFASLAAQEAGCKYLRAS
jgi:hypothetical protein